MCLSSGLIPESSFISRFLLTFHSQVCVSIRTLLWQTQRHNMNPKSFVFMPVQGQLHYHYIHNVEYSSYSRNRIIEFTWFGMGIHMSFSNITEILMVIYISWIILTSYIGLNLNYSTCCLAVLLPFLPIITCLSSLFWSSNAKPRQVNFTIDIAMILIVLASLNSFISDCIIF